MPLIDSLFKDQLFGALSAFFYLIQFLWSMFLFWSPRTLPAFRRSLIVLEVIVGLQVLVTLVALLSNQPVASGRTGDYLMYLSFVVLTVVAEEILLPGRVLKTGVVARWMWLVTLFGFGVAFRAVEVFYKVRVA